jgi:hypothetical protein
MTIQNRLFKLLQTVIFWTLVFGISGGVIGFLLAGKAGVANFFVWGLMIGMFIGVVRGFTIFLERIQEDTYDHTRLRLLGLGGWMARTKNGKSEK